MLRWHWHKPGRFCALNTKQKNRTFRNTGLTEVVCTHEGSVRHVLGCEFHGFSCLVIDFHWRYGQNTCKTPSSTEHLAMPESVEQAQSAVEAVISLACLLRVLPQLMRDCSISMRRYWPPVPEGGVCVCNLEI